jgi:hypothetical protein
MTIKDKFFSKKKHKSSLGKNKLLKKHVKNRNQNRRLPRFHLDFK